jgi:PIN domain-containing protein
VTEAAYVDSSYLIAIAVGEPGHRDLTEKLDRYPRVFSSLLLEAELRSALSRQGSKGKIQNLLAWMEWVLPYSRLTREIDQILHIGFLRGADLWHLSCALFLRRKMGPISFLTLDGDQGAIARALGFPGL